jgi:archaellum biogenesis protein FlaJ (TadC family)
MVTALVGLLVAGVVGIVVLVMLMAVLGLVLGTVGMLVALAFKLLPLVLIGWVVVKLIQKSERGSRPRIASSDRAWLDS